MLSSGPLSSHRAGLRALINNMGWLLGDQVVRLITGLVVGIWVARYLGPEQVGLLSLVAAVMGVAAVVAAFGLDAVVVKELVARPAHRDRILGTAVGLRFGVGIVSAAFPVTAMLFLRDGSNLALRIAAISVLALPFQSLGPVEAWFQAQSRVRAVVLVKNVVTLGMAGVRVLLLVREASIEAFVWAGTIEAVAVAAALFLIYRFAGAAGGAWRFEWSEARRLGAEGLPVMLSGLAVLVYVKTDQVMLGMLHDDHALGTFSVAVRLSEIWHFIPMALAAAVFPAIAGRDAAANDAGFRKLFDVMFLTALALAVPISLFAREIVGVLYGPAFSGAADVLVVHIWGNIFVFLGVASGRWLILNGLSRFLLYRTLAGAALNVGLNLVLIPRYGPVGAAWATLASQVLAAYAFDLSDRRLRPLFYMKSESMFLFGPSLRRYLWGGAGR